MANTLPSPGRRRITTGPAPFITKMNRNLIRGLVHPLGKKFKASELVIQLLLLEIHVNISNKSWRATAMKATQAIRERIAAHPPGEAFTPALFAGMGSRAAIDMALMREVRAGTIERLTRGVYIVPKPLGHGLKATPSAESVAKLLAQEGETIGVLGAQAAQRFGFSTQMVVREAFATTGPSRRLRYGKRTLELKHVSPRKMALGTGPAGQALLALWYLGKREVTPSTFNVLKKKLTPLEFQRLSQAKSVMPSWMAEAMAAYESTESKHG